MRRKENVACASSWQIVSKACNRCRQWLQGKVIGSMSTSPEPANDFDSIVTALKPAFDNALLRRNFLLANLLAMGAAESLFELDPEQARMLAWNEFFARLSGRYRTQYQCLDFEVVDYRLYPLGSIWSLLRGPRPGLSALATGRYVTFMGAAQLFGRFQKQAPHEVVGKALGISCLNLSSGGAGPELYTNDELIKLCNGGQAVVLQVLSGRSIGCDEYPGMRLTRRSSDDATKIDRLKLLGEIWSNSPQEAMRLARKWQQGYMDLMSAVIDRIKVPIVLTWVSTRAASDWSIEHINNEPNFGAFPQLVDHAMVTPLAKKCAYFVEVSRDDGLPYGFVSRFTGKECPVLRPNGKPVWKNDYY